MRGTTSYAIQSDCLYLQSLGAPVCHHGPGEPFGELKFRKFKFGITGTLFIGLGIGYFLTRYAATFAKGSKYYASAMKVMQGKVIDGSLMNLALLIFIVGTGLLAAKDMKYAINKFGKQFVALAIFIPFVGAVASYGFPRLWTT